MDAVAEVDLLGVRIRGRYVVLDSSRGEELAVVSGIVVGGSDLHDLEREGIAAVAVVRRFGQFKRTRANGVFRIRRTREEIIVQRDNRILIVGLGRHGEGIAEEVRRAAVIADVGDLDIEVLLPLGNEHDVLVADGVGFAVLVQLGGACVEGGDGGDDGSVGSLHDFPAEEGIAFAGRVGGHGDCAAGDVVVVDVLLGVAVIRHALDFLASCTLIIGEAIEESGSIERQLAVEVIALALAELVIALVAVAVGQVLQLRPSDLAGLCVEVRRIRMRGVGAGFQRALDGIEPGIGDIRHRLERRKHQSRGHFADRNPLFVGVVIAAELAGRETGARERGLVQLTVHDLLILVLDRRVLVDQLIAIGINGLDEEVDRCGAPLCRQGYIGGDGSVVEVERFFCLVQIPAVEGIAGLLGSSRRGRLEAVFHFLRGRNGRAAVRIESDGILVDVPLRRQGDVLCDGGIKVILGGVLLVFAQIPEGKGIALERRLGRQDSLLAALDVLRNGRRRTAVSVEGNGIFLRHMHEALRLDLPAAPGPDQRDRIDLIIVLDMFQIRERRVERGHIEVGDIADVAKPVVPVLPRLADEVVFIVLAEQTVVARMPLRSIYVALDPNSLFKLFQLVSRRGFGLAGDLDDRADLRQVAVHRDEIPLCTIPNPAHRGDCVGVGVFVAGKVFVKFFYVLIPKDRNGIRPDAIDLLNRWVGFCEAASLRQVIPLFIRLVLAYYPNILISAGNGRLCGRGLGLAALDFDRRRRGCLVLVVRPLCIAKLIQIDRDRSHIRCVLFLLGISPVEFFNIFSGGNRNGAGLQVGAQICYRTSHEGAVLERHRLIWVVDVRSDAIHNDIKVDVRKGGGIRGRFALDFDHCKIAALDLPFGACSVVFENKLNGVSDFSRRMPGVWIIAVIGIHVGLNIEPNRVFAVFNFFTAAGNLVGFDLVRLFIVSRARGAAYSHAVQLAQIVVLRSSRFDFRLGAVDRNLGIFRLIAFLSDPPVVSVEFERYGHSFAYARFSLMPGVVSVKGIYIRLNFERHRAFAVLDCADRDKRIVHIAKIRVAMFLGYGAVDVYKRDVLQLIHCRCRGLDFRRGAGGIDRPLRNVRHIHFLICVPFEADQLLCFCRCMLIPLILFQSIIRFDILGSIKGDNNTILFREILHVALNAAGNIVERVVSVIYSSRRAVYCNLKIRPVDIRAVAVEDGIGDDFRLLQLPDGVEGGIRRDGDQVTLRVSSTRRVWILIPAEEVVAGSGWNCAGDGERCLTIRICIRNRGRIRHIGYRSVRDVIVIGQGVGDLWRRVCDVNNDRRNVCQSGLRGILLVAYPLITLIVIEPVKCYRCRLPILKIMCTRPC